MTGNSGDVALAHCVEVRRALACVVRLLLAVSMLQPSEKSGIRMTIKFGQA